MSRKKNIITTVVLVVILLVGLSVMLYPTVSNWWNSKTQSRVVANYQQAVSDLDEEEVERILNEAREYNRELAQLASPLTAYEQIEGYEDILDITGTGVMGFISIPQINVELPIYHGTSESVLNIAVGHLQGSSLPVGGSTTHAVISAHRGLPSAELFSDLDQLVEGDRFTITVLTETFTYEVDKISIVLPSETENLSIENGKDYVTLMTCTPYGINTHRLLVRAHRVANDEAESEVTALADAVQIDSLNVVPFIAAPLVLILLIYWFFGGRKKDKFPHSDPLKALEQIKKLNDNSNDDKGG
ncbi:MAG: class C sortase [Ruminococcus sp.]|nr:class C sortase [Ruminococcus sp.]